MDTQRLVLLIVFTFSSVMLWEGWQKQHQPLPVTAAAQIQSGAAPGSVPTPTPTAAVAGSNAASVPGTESVVAAQAEKAVVTTDLFKAEISAQGGDLVHLELIHHKATGDEKKNYVLIDSVEHHYSAQSGLIGDGLPNHKTLFKLSGHEFQLKDGADKLEVRLEAPAVGNMAVSKVYTFHRGNYVVDVGYEIHNGGTLPVAPSAYFQFVRDGESSEESSSTAKAFTGPAVYTDSEKFQKVDFSDVDKDKAKFAHKAPDGWIAMVQHYFVAGWLPAQGAGEREFFVRKIAEKLYTAGVILPVAKVAAGATGRIDVPLYAGPQEQDKLKALAPGFDLVVDYGWLTVIAAPLFWVLEWIHKLVGNWGWAIIALTVLLKAAFFPLSAASYRSMAKMKVVTPRMQKLKEQFGSDKARLNQEMMELYRKEKINPLGGCLPILVQIPVFISLYWVLMGTVEMRHAPWLLWIQDLSSKDPYYVLPLIMGATMLIQTKLNPAPPDPVQAKVMLLMPIIFTGMFLFFPSGLVLYWVVNNVLSIAQQWQITRATQGVTAH